MKLQMLKTIASVNIALSPMKMSLISFALSHYKGDGACEAMFYACTLAVFQDLVR
jgi:hypothetical protein